MRCSNKQTDGDLTIKCTYDAILKGSYTSFLTSMPAMKSYFIIESTFDIRM